MRRVLATAMLALLTTGWNAAAQSNDFRWSGVLAAGKTIEVRGVNGTVRAELAPGNQVEVTAEKRARRSDPESVTVQVVEDNGNVVICAVYPTSSSYSNRRRTRDDDGPNECRGGNGGRMNSGNNDVVVDFTVRVPAGVRFVGRTVNGTIDADSLQSDADVSSVNGRVSLTTTGLARAETVNGAIDVTMGSAAPGSAAATEPLAFKTVNGSIEVRLPPGTDVSVRANTLNGRFTSDLPLMISSTEGRGRRVIGTIGNGGRELDLHTVNGSIRLLSSAQP